MARKKKPVKIAGIEADALISEDRNYSAEIPEYPVEKGFNVSDTIILKPIELGLTLYISDSPVTWRNRSGHKPKNGRTKKICDKFEKLYFKRKLIKVVTNDKIYTNMGITALTISHTSETGYSRQISLSLKKVYVTKRKTVHIPSYILQSGESSKNAGAATTSKGSNGTGASGSSGNTKSSASSKGSSSGSSSKGGSSKSSKSSILYGVASSMGFI